MRVYVCVCVRWNHRLDSRPRCQIARHVSSFCLAQPSPVTSAIASVSLSGGVSAVASVGVSAGVVLSVGVSAHPSGPRLSLHPVCCAANPLFPFDNDGHV